MQIIATRRPESERHPTRRHQQDRPERPDDETDDSQDVPGRHRLSSRKSLIGEMLAPSPGGNQ
jgi:hypothetical protein